MTIHRDYTSSSDSQIKVFPDRILFFNPGTLPDSITIEQLLTNTYVSTPRNRQIAKMVKEMGMIEKYGTGIKRVRKMFIEYRLPEPKFEIIPGGFAVTVYSNTDQEDHKTTENVVENVVENVIENETQITQLLYQNKSYSAYEIAKILNKSERTIQRYLNLLIKKKRIQRIGPDKGGHWEIINRL